LGITVRGRLEQATLADASPGIQLQRPSTAVIVSGPMDTRALVDVVVPARGHQVNAVGFPFRTVSSNLFVNRVETFDGIVPLQRFAGSARSVGTEGLSGRPFRFTLGFLSRPRLIDDLLVRMEIFFTNKDGFPEVEFGVLQLEEVRADTLVQGVVER
jgi:hypothetical protein